MTVAQSGSSSSSSSSSSSGPCRGREMRSVCCRNQHQNRCRHPYNSQGSSSSSSSSSSSRVGLF